MSRRRAVLVVSVLVAVALAAWWLSSGEDPAPPVVATAPAEPPRRAVQPDAVLAVVPAAPMDAAVADSADAGEAESFRSSTHYLRPGNTTAVVPDSETEFQKACTREAEACVRWLTPGRERVYPPPFTLEGAKGSTRVTGVSERFARLRQGAPMDPFSACLLRGMQAQTLVESEPGQTSCTLRGFWSRHDSTELLLTRLVDCVGPRSDAEVVTIEVAERLDGLVLRPLSVTVSALGPLDLSAESCIKLAATREPVTLSEDQRPDFVRHRHRLTVVLTKEGEPAMQPLDFKALMKLKAEPFARPEPVTLDATGTEEVARLTAAAQAALSAGNAAVARDEATACLSHSPTELACQRLRAEAWLKLVRAEPSSQGLGTLRAWTEFLLLAPPDDPGRSRVGAALVRAGGELP